MLLGIIAVASACAPGTRPFPLKAPLWHDPDRRPFEGEPEEYFSPFAWDGANQTIFRPFARFFAVDPGGEAVNVNALDEVPNSSWFQNRIGWFPMTPEAIAHGPCDPPRTDPKPPWKVTGAKPNGANPGFIIEDAKGDRYLVKFDGTLQGPRATAADVIVSKLYYAAGYTTPCNQVVFFDRSILSIDPEATSEDETGDEEPLTDEHIDRVLEKSVRLPDGRYRASSSLFLKGKPIGPFTYEGTRDDDPNDVVPHEDRRDLRGAYVLAAWTNHFDSREQNTLAMWIETSGGRGYVQHDMIDFGDCFGSIWEPPMLGRRIGHAHYFDPGYVAADTFTFGFIRRPWDHARFGPSGTVFGYYDVDSFEADAWRPGYPNPAFSRMTERDAAWMTRIVSEFDDERLRVLVKAGRFNDDFVEKELLRILRGRRDRILRRYFSRLSPLSHPSVERRDRSARLCLRDLAVASGVVEERERVYSAVVRSDELEPVATLPVSTEGGARICATLPDARYESHGAPAYWIVDVGSRFRSRETPGPARVHLYQLGPADYRIVGLERPEP